MKIYFKDKEVEELERELRDLEHEIGAQHGKWKILEIS